MDKSLKLNVTEAVLTRMNFHQRCCISGEVISDLKVDTWVDAATDDLIISMRASIFGQASADLEVIQYPATWWEAVKQRFAPSWVVRHWPVVYTKHVIEHKILYPNLAHPQNTLRVPYVHVTKPHSWVTEEE